MTAAKAPAAVPLAWLLAFGIGIIPSVAIGGKAPPIPRATEPVITTGPRAWALATTALLTYRNGQRLDMLSSGARSDSNVAEVRQILHDWWGIDDRADLLRVLEHLDREGHRATFQRHGQSLLGMPVGRYRMALLAARDQPEVARRMKLCREYYPRYRLNSLVGWDYCRYIMLCRWGYTLGFLTEEEAWARIMPAARKIQHGFGSWVEVGQDYLVGREFWSQEETERTGQIYRDIQAWLVREPRSPWNQLSWRMELGADAPTSPR
jgi:hypothetical protein